MNHDNLQMTIEQQERIHLLLQLYNDEQDLRLKPQKGVRAENQRDVLRLIDRLRFRKSLG